MSRLLLIIGTLAATVPMLWAYEPTAKVPSFARDTREHIAELLAWRNLDPPVSLRVSQVLSHEDITHLYEERGYEPLWFDGCGLRPAARQLLEHLRNAGQQGLCPENYLLDPLETLIRVRENFAWHRLQVAADNRALLDLFLSQAFLSYAGHLIEGQVDPALAHVDWRARRRKADVVKLLNYAVGQNRLSQVLDGLLPPHPGYHRLVDALQYYSTITAMGGWPRFPNGPILRPGNRDARLSLLRERLVIEGDLNGEIPVNDVYDKVTQAAVRKFQSRHGLVVDGVIGPKTLAALNITAAERVRQIELNLERWRWLPKNLGQRYVQINIADFSLTVVEDDVPLMTMPVIVGTPYRKTPVFSARMTYLEFSPYWTVPSTILREDKLPKIKSDPGYLAKNRFRVLRPENGTLVELDPETIDWRKVEAKDFPGILRMDPGPWNPLGRVKFMFPNGFNVYMHDTNESDLFNQDILSFSSGCIRILRPFDLAQYLLEKVDGMDCSRLIELHDSSSPQKVSIPPIPVHIQYWTAWVATDGSVQFRDDVYLRDLDLEIALAEPAYRTSDQLQISCGK